MRQDHVGVVRLQRVLVQLSSRGTPLDVIVVRLLVLVLQLVLAGVVPDLVARQRHVPELARHSVEEANVGLVGHTRIACKGPWAHVAAAVERGVLWLGAIASCGSGALTDLRSNFFSDVCSAQSRSYVTLSGASGSQLARETSRATGLANTQASNVHLTAGLQCMLAAAPSLPGTRRL